MGKAKAIIDVFKPKKYARKICVCGIFHILEDTYLFLKQLKEYGVEINSVIAKPFSKNDQYVELIREELGIEVIEKSYSTISKSSFIKKYLKVNTNPSLLNITIDIGGYFSQIYKFDNSVNGIIEVTTFGYKKYEKTLKSFEIPVFTVATSPIKEVEAIYVGKSAVLSLDLVLRDLGQSLLTKNCLSIGFGMIGSNVANAARSYGMPTSVYDLSSYKTLRAGLEGFKVGEKSELLAEADVIFSSTAQQSLTFREINRSCKKEVYLCSVGSKTNEFPVVDLQGKAHKIERVNDHISRYHLARNIVNLVKGGESVNFIVDSCPTDVMEMLYAEIFSCMISILEGDFQLREFNLSNAGQVDLISKNYLMSKQKIVS